MSSSTCCWSLWQLFLVDIVCRQTYSAWALMALIVCMCTRLDIICCWSLLVANCCLQKMDH